MSLFQKCGSEIFLSSFRQSCSPKDHSAPPSASCSAHFVSPAKSPAVRSPGTAQLSSAAALACLSPLSGPGSSSSLPSPAAHTLSRLPRPAAHTLSRTPSLAAHLLSHPPSLVWRSSSQLSSLACHSSSWPSVPGVRPLGSCVAHLPLLPLLSRSFARASLRLIWIACVDFLLTQILRPHRYGIQQLIILVRRLCFVLGAILVPLIPARVVFLMVRGSTIRLSYHVGAFLLILASGFLCVSVLLLRPRTFWLLGCDCICLSCLVPAPRTLLQVHWCIVCLLLIGAFHPLIVAVQQDCVSHFQGLSFSVMHIFQGQVSISWSVSASVSFSFKLYRSSRRSSGGTCFYRYH